MEASCPFTFIDVSLLTCVCIYIHICISSPLVFFAKVQDSPLLVCFLFFRTNSSCDLRVKKPLVRIWGNPGCQVYCHHILFLRTWDLAVSTAPEDWGECRAFRPGHWFCSPHILLVTKFGTTDRAEVLKSALDSWRSAGSSKLWSAPRAARLVCGTCKGCSWDWNLLRQV